MGQLAEHEGVLLLVAGRLPQQRPEFGGVRGSSRARQARPVAPAEQPLADSPGGQLRRPPVQLSDIVSMSAVDMAKRSHLVMSAYRELVDMAKSLRNPAYRKPMLDILLDPKITFLSLYPTRADREAIRNELARFEYMSTEDDVEELFPPNGLKVQPYYASSQSHDDFYVRPSGYIELCNVPLPVRPIASAAAK